MACSHSQSFKPQQLASSNLLWLLYIASGNIRPMWACHGALYYSICCAERRKVEVIYYG